MNTIALISAISAASVAVASSADSPTTKQLQSLPKNLARQHSTANLFLFDAASRKFVATEAAAAWLDDDVSTGWPAVSGKQYYLLQLAEPQLITSFALSGKPSAGTISIFAGDDALPPDDKAWTPVAQNVAFESVNNKKLGKGFSRVSKCLLIETNIAEPESIYSLYVYGEKSAANEGISQRPQPVDVRAVHGEFVNNQTSFNIAGIYAKARVTYSNADGSNFAWQRAIDDNPESAATLRPSSGESGMIVRFDGAHPISRLSVLTDGAKGRIDIFLLSEAPEAGRPVSIEGIQPSVTLSFDGSSPRASAELAETTSTAMVLRWMPEANDALASIFEINAFADLSLADFEVVGAPPAIAEGPKPPAGEPTEDGKATANNGSDHKSVADGKTLAPVGLGKEMIDPKKGGLDPVGLGPGRGTNPGGLGFPPRTPPIAVLPPNPRSPVSP
jgi:hypothetical protein